MEEKQTGNFDPDLACFWTPGPIDLAGKIGLRLNKSPKTMYGSGLELSWIGSSDQVRARPSSVRRVFYSRSVGFIGKFFGEYTRKLSGRASFACRQRLRPRFC
jgi:hypothetical protein